MDENQPPQHDTVAQAIERRNARIRAAKAAGTSITAIARAEGLSRQGVYNILALPAQDPPAGARPRST